MTDTNKTTRRKFLKKAALTIGAPMIVPSSVLGLDGHVAPSNQIVLGGVGLGPRGRKDLTCFLKQPDVRFVTVADPQKERREIIQRFAQKVYDNNECKPVQDMYEVFERDDIDAVLIATGDRWQKRAFCQKLSRSPWMRASKRQDYSTSSPPASTSSIRSLF